MFGRGRWRSVSDARSGSQRLTVGYGRVPGEPGTDEPNAAVRQTLDELDINTTLLGQHPNVVQVFDRVGPHQHFPRHTAQQDSRGLADAGLDQIDVVDAVGDTQS